MKELECVNMCVSVCECLHVCVWNEGVWGSWDPLSQTCTDLSNQTGIKGQEGRAEDMRALECVYMCASVCMCAYLRICE